MDMFVSPAATAASGPIPSDISAALTAAAHSLLTLLARGQAVDTATLREVMTTAFGGSDADGAWDWKTAYDSGEATTVLFLRKFGRGIRGRAGSGAALLAMLAKVTALLPSHRRRSEESQALQQFPTPIALGFAAATAAAITPADLVLEPSAGTSAGKGRQVAGILLDNWRKGRGRAVWISKSDKLIEDAQRDWSALGMERLLVTPLAHFRQGTPIRLEQGVLFTTRATLRTAAREERVSRVHQIVDWFGSGFDGVIVFDESHAMGNAAVGKGERDDQAPPQRGRAGLRLQPAPPNARTVYVSATGATTVHNLAYAKRLGLRGSEDFLFTTRAEFVQAIEAGDVAAMEVLARDIKSLGLYRARSLDTLGAITKGQRQTGGQGLFRSEDNLECDYCRTALRQVYCLLFAGKVEDFSGLQLRRAKVMGAFWVELTGFTDGMVERLKALGLFSEIIAWKLRLFVPTAANEATVLGTLMERFALVRIADRAAA